MYRINRVDKRVVPISSKMARLIKDFPVNAPSAGSYQFLTQFDRLDLWYAFKWINKISQTTVL